MWVHTCALQKYIFDQLISLQRSLKQQKDLEETI